MPVLRLLLVRLLVFAATLAGAVALVQALLWAAPGDPIDLLPESEEIRPVLEAEWGLDRPLPERFARYFADVARGDLGTSLTYRPGAPVAQIIAEPAIRSFSWLFASLAIAIGWGTALAWRSAGRPSKVRGAVLLVSIAPVFLLAHVLVNGINEAAFWAMNEGILERPAWFALPAQPSGLRTALAVLVLCVGSGTLAQVQGEVEDALVRIRTSAYVTAARARGTPVWPHVAMNLLGPLTALASTRAAFFVGGLVVLEKVLLLNGVGAILWKAALLRDYPLAMGITVVLAAVVCATRLLCDAVRIATDPRMRTEAAR